MVLVYPTAPLLTVFQQMANNGYIRYPVMQIRPYGLMVYERTEYDIKPRRKDRTPLTPDQPDPISSKFEENTGIAQYHGHLTPGARKRLKRAIQLICAIAEPKTAMNFKLNKEFKFKLNFITLTLPVPQGDRTDKQIKKEVLDVWLKSAKRLFKLRSYIWRAERQKNGNLHFHIVTDTYLPYDQLRDSWNNRLNRLGMIDEFEKKHGHRHPNSTDVHAIKKVRNLAAYFSKYMAKDAPIDQPIDGKLWDCSRNLKYSKNCETMLESEALETWMRVINDPEVKTKELDYCSIAFLTRPQFKKYIIGDMKTHYVSWLSVIRNIPDEVIDKPPQPTVHVPF